MAKKTGLGRGLGALIDNVNVSVPEVRAVSNSSINEVRIEFIEANPFQPRTNFDEEALQDLAASIKHLGIIQPISLRRVSPDRYQIIAGERRFRASKLAGLKTVPAYIRDAKDEGMREMALVENIQREDLDAIEVALSYQQLIDEYNLSQETLSERVGKKRSTITNYLRLLKLSTPIQKGIIEDVISMGHARALVSVENPEDQLKIYELIVSEDLSVRKAEELVKSWKENKPLVSTKPKKEKYPEEFNDLRVHLNEFFSSNVDFSMDSNGKGKISIPFTSTEDLERIMSILDK
ncbi:MAG: ParB/RepB/Spo0J family partition protein [Mangrovibacterium sp.]